MIARAKLINCLSPSDSLDPPSPTIVSYPFGYQFILNFEGNSISQSSTILVNSTAGDSSCVIKELSSTKYDSEHPVFSHVRVVSSINPSTTNRSVYLEIYVPNSKTGKITSALYYSIHCTGGSPLENHKFELIKGDDKGYVYKDDIFKVQDYTGDQTKSNNENEYFKIRVCKLSPTDTPNLNYNDVEFYDESGINKINTLRFGEAGDSYKCAFTIKVDPGLKLDIKDGNDVNIDFGSYAGDAQVVIQHSTDKINDYTLKYLVYMHPLEDFNADAGNNGIANIVLQKSVKYPISISLPINA